LLFRGYSDFGYGRPLFEKRPEGGLRGSTNFFTLGDFDLFVSAQISDRLSVLGEALITSDFSNSFGIMMSMAFPRGMSETSVCRTFYWIALFHRKRFGE